MAGPVTPHCAAAQGVRVTEVPLSTGSLGSDDVFMSGPGRKDHCLGGLCSDRDGEEQGAHIHGRPQR